MPTPGDQAWKQGDALTAARLEQMRTSAVREFTATGRGVSVARQGGSVALAIVPPPVPVGQLVKVKITSNCTGGGLYNCVLAKEYPQSLPDGTGNLISSMLAVYGAEDDAIYANTNEIGKTTHALGETTEVTEFWGIYLGQNADGRHVVEGPGVQFRPCPSSAAISFTPGAVPGVLPDVPPEA